MKAIIVEIKGRYAAVLSDDGLVSKIKNRNYSLGQEIAIRDKNNGFIKIVASAAAAVMLFVTPAWAYLTPYSYVSLDVNPSFEFSLNRFDRVLAVKAVNDDGEEFVKNVNVDGLKNKEIQNAVKDVLNELENQGYIIEGEEGGVIVATSSKTKEKTEMLAEKLRNTVSEEALEQDKEDSEIKTEENQEKLEKPEKIEKPEKPEKDDKPEKQENPEKPEKPEKPDKSKEIEKSEKSDKSEKNDKPEKPEKPNVKVIEVTEKEVDEAKRIGITPGKMNLIGKLQEAAKEVGYEENADDWFDSSAKDINAKIKEYKIESKQEEKESKEELDQEEKENKKDTNASPSKGKGKGNKNEEDSRNDDNDNNDNKGKKND